MAKSISDIFNRGYGFSNTVFGKIPNTRPSSRSSRSAAHDPQLLAEYKTLAMRADKRLQRLEKYAQRPGMGELLKGAYARAMREIKT